MTPGIDTRTLARELLALSDSRLRALYQRRPWRSAMALARCWGVIAGGFALVVFDPSAAAIAVAFVAIGTQQYALSILSHEAKHRTLLASPRLNDLAGLWLTSAPLGTSFLAERRRHLAHHDRLGHDDDPDRDLYRAADKARGRDFLLYISGLTTFPGRRKSAARDAGQTARERGLAPLLQERWQAIPAQAALVAVFALFLDGWLYIVLWVAPLVGLLLIPARVRQFCEHAHPVLPDSAADIRRLVTYRPGALERLLLAPFHMSYHAEHHLWPGVPCWNLPRLAALLPDDPRIERRGTYGAFLLSYFRSLPLIQMGPIAARG